MDDFSYSYSTADSPNEQLPFEVLSDEGQRFNPTYYPDRFPHTRAKELSQRGGNCESQKVNVKEFKNREFHVSGILLGGNVNTFNWLMDYNEPVTLISAIAPNGGLECFIKKAEIDATPSGYDGRFREWQFDYTIDFVATHSEATDDENEIITAFADDANGF